MGVFLIVVSSVPLGCVRGRPSMERGGEISESQKRGENFWVACDHSITTMGIHDINLAKPMLCRLPSTPDNPILSRLSPLPFFLACGRYLH